MGLPTALLLAKSGNNVKGYDIDKRKIQLLQNKKLPFEEPGLERLFQQVMHNFHASNTLESSDVFIITVPTPLTQEKTCDLSFVLSAVDAVKDVLQDGNLVVLESTVPPGTTIDKVKPVLDATKKHYYLSYVSEKAIPGNTIFEMQQNHRIIGGIDDESALKTKQVYGQFVKSTIHLTDATTAETVKLIENTYRDVNIALANELAQRLTEQQVNIWEAISLANYHPRVHLHQPGPGVGGHCIPIDPWFLMTDTTKLIRQARKINEAMPGVVVEMVEELVEHITDSTIVLLGVSYKGNVDDARESPSFVIKDIAEERGIQVRLFDPYVKGNPTVFTDFSKATEDADCLIVVTDHEVFKDLDPNTITNMDRKIIVDARNILNYEKWIEAGFMVRVLGTTEFKGKYDDD